MSTRLEFIEFALRPGANIAALCSAFGISRKTGYKWLQRFGNEGSSGLQDKSRRPGSSPGITPADLEAEVLELNDRYPCWGGRKLRALLPEGRRPHHSTIDAILRRHDRKVLGAPDKNIVAPTRFEHSSPNQLWQIDFKGHFSRPSWMTTPVLACAWQHVATNGGRRYKPP